MSKNLLFPLVLVFFISVGALYFLRERDACRRIALAPQLPGESPLSCNARALTAGEHIHHTVLTQKLFVAVASKRELPDGMAFRLDPSAITLAELADWVDAERRCCPFLDFKISLAREGGPLELALTGRPGVKSLLLTLFGQASSTAGVTSRQ